MTVAEESDNGKSVPVSPAEKVETLVQSVASQDATQNSSDNDSTNIAVGDQYYKICDISKKTKFHPIVFSFLHSLTQIIFTHSVLCN